MDLVNAPPSPPAPESRSVPVPGTTLTAWRWQRPARVPGAAPARVLFAHGISDDGRCWDPIVTALWASHPGAVDAVAYDARGHGRSQPLGCAGSPGALGRAGADHLAPPRAATVPPAPATLARLADDLIAVAGALGLERPLLVGHSMGAMTAALAEARAPGLARGLLLEDPPSPWAPLPGPLPAAVARGEERPPLPTWLAALRGRAPAEIAAEGRRERPGWPEDELAPWAAAKSAVAADVGWLFLSLREDWSRDLARVGCPVLVLAGDPARGGLLPPNDAARLVALFGAGSLERVSGAGHNVRRDARPAFLAALRRTLAAAG
ncbi:MAG TPA: alpha/beta hydrolase [Polyangiaceae bacterium]|nr:alpha/beta hydrolase [Polyangiaceae bacterium]